MSTSHRIIERGTRLQGPAALSWIAGIAILGDSYRVDFKGHQWAIKQHWPEVDDDGESYIYFVLRRVEESISA